MFMETPCVQPLKDLLLRSTGVLGEGGDYMLYVADA